jgi:hypothetical protein
MMRENDFYKCERQFRHDYPKYEQEYANTIAELQENMAKQEAKEKALWIVYCKICADINALQISQQDRLHLQRDAFLDMSFIQRYKPLGQFEKYHKLFHMVDIELASFHPFEVMMVVIATKDCPESESIDGMLLTVEEAREKQMLPYAGCTRPGKCICLYKSQPIRDVNGRLVTKVV